MTQQEKIEICSSCKNRKMELKRGLICSLTNDKPQFEQMCDAYSEEERIVKERIKNTPSSVTKSPESKIFAAIAVYFAVLALISAFVSPPSFSFFTLFIFAAPVIFYYNISNVRDKFTSILGCVIYLIHAVICIVIAGLTNFPALFIGLGVIHVCVAFWGIKWAKTYAEKSPFGNTVKNSTRLSYCIWALLCLSSTIPLLDAFVIDAELMFKSNVEKVNEELPVEISDGLILTHIFVEGESVVYDVMYADVSYSDYDELTLSMMPIFVKNQKMVAYAYADKESEEVKKIQRYLGKGYGLKVRSFSNDSTLLCSVTFTLDELKKVLSSQSYKCPLSDIQQLISLYRKALPFEHLLGGVLRDVTLDSAEEELIYEIHMPFTSTDMKELSYRDFEEYILSQWQSLQDPVACLAMINNMTIGFKFSSELGEECYHIKITPDLY